MSVKKLLSIWSTALFCAVVLLFVSCSDSDDSSDSSSTGINSDYPITGHWVHSLHDYESFLILDLDGDGTGIQSKRYHGVMEYEIPILYEYKNGTLTIISDENGKQTYTCRWMGKDAIALTGGRAQKEYWDRTSTLTDMGKGISRYDIVSMIPKCITVESSYEDLLWHITIKSTLHNLFPNAQLKFCISHGSVDGLKYDQYEDQVWKGCEVSYDNDVRICKIKFPYWAYYILGKGNDPEIGAELEVYYMSYSYLKQKQEEGVALSTDELIFMNDLYEILSERLPEAKENYILEVQVEVNDTHTFFIQNLHLSDICK